MATTWELADGSSLLADLADALAREVECTFQVAANLKPSEKGPIGGWSSTLLVMERKSYSTDVSDAEWACLAPHVPAPKPGGRPPKHARREIVNAIFYVIRSGEPWRLLPHDRPPWQTVFNYIRLWRLDGTRDRIHTALRE